MEKPRLKKLNLAPAVSNKRMSNLENQFQALNDRVNAQGEDQRSMKELLQQLVNSVSKIQEQLEPRRDDLDNRHNNFRNDNNFRDSSFTRIQGCVPKLEFPKFDGSNPRMWLKKCSKYFTLCNIPEDQRVDMACLNMIDKAECWMSSYVTVKKNVDWGEFCVDITARFRDDSSTHVVEKFNKLCQMGDLESYVDEFENLRSLMIQQNNMLPDSYFLDSFVGGLKPTVKPFVRAFKPETLSAAIEYARLEEEILEAYKQTVSPRFVSNTYKPSSKPLPALLPTPSTKLNTIQSTSTSAKPFQRPYTALTAAERREKQAKGLCYFCDQPYDRNHRCKLKQSQLFAIEIPAEDDCEEDEDHIDSIEDESYLAIANMEPCISIYALCGNHAFQTMRVAGYCKGKPIHILIDSGSTHNFLDMEFVKRMGLEMENIATQAVTVADGNHLACQAVCKQFSWELKCSFLT